MVAIWGFQCQGKGCFKVYRTPHSEIDTVILENLIEEGTCLKCGGDLRIMLAPPAETVVYEEIPASEYWNRMNGVGSTAERIWGCDKVRELLLGGRVVEVELIESETKRCCVRSLKMESGHVLHFAVSGYGEAVIYKITEE